MGGGGSQTASGPAPYGYDDMVRAGRRKEITENKDLDEESRSDLLSMMDKNADDPNITTKYQQALDPENPTTKDRKRRAAAKKIEEDQPGIRKQTTYLSTSASSKSYMGR